jgi:hypothetical protein
MVQRRFTSFLSHDVRITSKKKKKKKENTENRCGFDRFFVRKGARKQVPRIDSLVFFLFNAFQIMWYYSCCYFAFILIFVDLFRLMRGLS